MKKINHSAFILLAALALPGCQKEVGSPAEREPITFRATAGLYQVKASDTAFEAGDAIGLSVGEPVSVSNAKLLVAADGITPQKTILWAAEQTDASTFDAYYPFLEDVDYIEGFNFCVNPDQSTHALFSASDLMSAHSESGPCDGIVELAFTHQLSKLVLEIDNRLDEEISQVYVGGIRGRAKVQAGTTPTAVGQAGTIKACSVSSTGSGDAFALVVVPQEASPKLMVITASGKQYTYVLPEAIRFESGMRYLSSITLSSEVNFTGLSTEVSEWTDNDDLQFPFTFADIMDGINGETYQVTGKIIQISNYSYGNMMLESDGLRLYIYGLLNQEGLYPYTLEGGFRNPDFDLAEGDIVTVRGPRTVMNGMVTLKAAFLVDARRQEPVLYDSVREVLEAEYGVKLSFNGIVHAVSTRGFVVYDGDAALLVYTGTTPQCSVGDMVKITGSTSIYRNCPEVNTPSYSVLSSDNPLYALNYTDITGTLDALSPREAIPVSVDGHLSIQGSTYSLTVEGASAMGDIYWPTSNLGLSALNDLDIHVEGFLLFKYSSTTEVVCSILATSAEAI